MKCMTLALASALALSSGFALAQGGGGGSGGGSSAGTGGGSIGSATGSSNPFERQHDQRHRERARIECPRCGKPRSFGQGDGRHQYIVKHKHRHLGSRFQRKIQR